jgi:uncharacterized protein YdhG (YjbR/CyaY superfamily)
MAAKPQTVDGYLARLSGEKRAALEKVRRAIRSAAPKAEECISYKIPAFRLAGRVLVWYAAWKDHCSLYPVPAAMRGHADLEPYETSKGTVRFPIGAPPSSAFVKKFVRARIAELHKGTGGE